MDRETVSTLEEAVKLAKRYMNMGDGEYVKKSRVINLENDIIINVSYDGII